MVSSPDGPTVGPGPSVGTFPAIPVKTWSLLTTSGVPYTLAVLPDASLWLQFGVSVPVQLDPLAMGQAMSDVSTTITQVLQANATCPFTKSVTVGTNAFTLQCDLPNKHANQFHHDPTTQLYYLPDD